MVVQNFSKTLKIGFISFNLSSLEKAVDRFEHFDRFKLFVPDLSSYHPQPISAGLASCFDGPIKPRDLFLHFIQAMILEKCWTKTFESISSAFFNTFKV